MGARRCGEGLREFIHTLQLSDADDRHILAAAIAGNADVIVTCNLKDFPKSALDPYCIAAQHPDEFIHELMDEGEDRVCLAVKRQTRSFVQAAQNRRGTLANPCRSAFAAHRRAPLSATR